MKQASLTERPRKSVQDLIDTSAGHSPHNFAHMALHNRAKAWLHRLSSGKSKASDWSEDNTASIQTMDEGCIQLCSMQDQWVESSHGTFRPTDAPPRQCFLRSQVLPCKPRERQWPSKQNDLFPDKGQDHCTLCPSWPFVTDDGRVSTTTHSLVQDLRNALCSAADNHASRCACSLHAMSRRTNAIHQPSRPCGRKKLRRSLSWKNMVSRRQASSSSLRFSEARSRHALPQDRGHSLPVPRSLPSSCNGDSNAALSPLRHVYSTAGVPSTSSSLLRSASHASTSSTTSSYASIISTLVSGPSMAYSPTVPSPGRIFSRVRSRPEPQSMPAAAQLDVQSRPTLSTASRTLLPSGHYPMQAGSTRAHFQMQEAECVVLTVRDANKQKLRVLFHSRLTTIDQVKQQIQSQMGNTISQQQLTFKGLLLQDDVSLGSFVQGSAAVLHLHAPFRNLLMW